MDIEGLTEALFRVTLSGVSPEEIIELAYRYTGKPIIAFDTAFRLYGYAFERPCRFEPWEFIARENYLPDDYIYSNKTLEYQQVLYDSRRSICLDYGTAREYPQVCAPIMYDGRLCGYVGIAVEGSEELEALKSVNDLLASALGIVIGRRAEKEAVDSGAYDLAALMNARQVTRPQAEYIAEHYKPPYITAVLRSCSASVPTLEYLNRRIQQEYKKVITGNGQSGQLMLLFPEVEELPLPKGLAENLGSIAARYRLRCGISDWFHDPAMIPQSRLQAELAAEQARCGSSIAIFRECILDLICRNADERYGHGVCLMPEFRDMKLKGTVRRDLIRTLDTYLFCGMSSVRTAQKMGLHKNTVYYRLNRLRRHIGAELENTEAFVDMSLGIMLFKYLGDEL